MGEATEKKYSEHRKLQAISAKSQAIGEFLEWLDYGGLGKDLGCVELSYRESYLDEQAEREAAIDDPPCWTRSDQLTPLMWRKEKLLAAYFRIDLDKIEAEKRAMLEECRLAYEDELEEAAP